MALTDDLETFIRGELIQGRDVDVLDADTDLLALGIVDSHGIVELVAFLEERCGITVGDDDLTPENFQSIRSIERFASGKQAGGTHAP